jgi:hypothetical protein
MPVPSPARSLPGAVVLAALLGLAAPACTRGTVYSRSGALQPTVAGRPAAAFASLAEARAAFSRSQGAMTATLKDAAWIRLEPDPQGAAGRHPSYFEGLTTFEVQVATDEIVRPTQEGYVLEDSTGGRVTATPERFKTDLGEGFGPRVLTEFTITFPHTLSREMRWIRLTREGPGGGTVTWEFPE